MLTKDDIKDLLQPLINKIDLLIKETNTLKITSEKFETNFKELENKITDLEIKIDEAKTDLSMSTFHVRAELKEETAHMKRTLKKIYESQEIIIKHFDQEFQSLRQRVDNVEKHLNP